MATPFMKGKTAFVRFLLDGEKVEVTVKSWEIECVGEEIADGVNGEDRDRIDYEINYFRISLELFKENPTLLKKLMANQANDDAGALPLAKGAGFVLKSQDGSKLGLKAEEMTIDNWKLASSGRTDRLMTTLPLRARYVSEVAGL